MCSAFYILWFNLCTTLCHYSYISGKIHCYNPLKEPIKQPY